MPDPYKVLGVSPTASDEEIKKAYRKLVKRYHPDMHPGDEACELKMKEVNAAYDAIVNRDRYAASGRSPYGGPAGYGGSGGGAYGGGGGTTSGGYGSPTGGGTWQDPFGGGYGWPFGGYSTQAQSPQMSAVRNHLDVRDFAGALDLLEAIPDHTAQWHYYYAMAARGLGDLDTARDHARRAQSMDPANIEYAMFLESLGVRDTRTVRMQPLGCGGEFVKWILILLFINLLLDLFMGMFGGGGMFLFL